jgi:branched-chain amino acid transport system permease protein
LDIFLQQIINGLILGSIYALVALGYTMVYGILGLINFAHGDVVMVGALTGLTLIRILAAAGLPVYLVLALSTLGAIAVCVCLGVTIERVAYRPLRRAPRLAPLITAIGVSILIQYSAATIWSKQYLALPGLLSPSTHVIAGAGITDIQIAIFALAWILMAGLLWLIKGSRTGRAMRATEQNPDVAGLMGVNVNQVIVFTFVVGSALAAIAGVMVLLYYGLAHYFMGFMLGLKAFTAAVLGGIGSVPGAMLGGLLLGVIESLASGYIGDLTGGVFGSNYRDVFAFLVLVVVLILRPSGLLGAAPVERA